MSIDSDHTEIMRLHTLWWESNFTFDILEMRSVFAGERYLQYNLNGHPYYGLEQKTKLWEALKGNLSIPEFSPPIDLRLEIGADMAWLACENIIRVQARPRLTLPGIPPTPFRIRSTEVYQRDDGAGIDLEDVAFSLFADCRRR